MPAGGLAEGQRVRTSRSRFDASSRRERRDGKRESLLESYLQVVQPAVGAQLGTRIVFGVILHTGTIFVTVS